MKYSEITCLEDYRQYERERQQRRYKKHKNEILAKKKAKYRGIPLTTEELEAARRLDKEANK